MTSRLVVLAIDALDEARIARFWCQVLGWQVREVDDTVVSIGPVDATWPTIDVCRVPERKTVKNRLHLDLRADGATTEAELARLRDLGATHVDVGQADDVTWVVLADPEGNEFCLLSRSVQELTPDERELDPERAGLVEFLDLQREALIRKLDGLSDHDARRTPTASSLCLLGLVKHSAIWERRWFQVIVAGRRFPGEWPEVRAEASDETFQLGDGDTVESVLAYYREQIAASRQVLGSFDLDAPCAWSQMAHRNLRWVALHMIEETARHAGHADIIRETIDGSRGV